MKEKKRILIVDDARFTRMKLKSIISNFDNIEVVGEAENGIEAIELYQKLKPDLVTMDLIMPKKGGIEAIGEIVNSDPKALIIVVSALGQESLLVEATKKGAKEFIQKPFNTEQITEVINRLL
ncbi:MAG: response regulator [Candidatus Hermodarchaeota archaeon]